MTDKREYRGESRDEWEHVTCPEGVEPEDEEEEDDE